ncbi:MAG: LLM class flavin-dependent oxidoreductase [Acidimicrobiales bacterium]
MIELPSPCLVVLVGPAGSGKSTWAATHLAASAVSSDALRALVGEGEHDLRASSDAFAVLDDVIERRLRRRLTTVVDTLGLDAARRAAYRSLASAAGVPCVAVVFDLAPATVRARNRNRSPRVPDDVVRRQLASWVEVRSAVAVEGFDAVHVIDDATDTGVSLVAPTLMRRRSTAPPIAATGAGVGAASGGLHQRMRFGLQVPQFTWAGGPTALAPTLRDIAARADRLGLDDLWLMDHVRQIPMFGPPWLDMLESWTTLAHLAACTNEIELGTLVTGITYRNVAHLGKIVATLDVLSGGRARCGLGLAWYADEHRAYGWAFPDRDQRYALLDDALHLLPMLWGPGNKPFAGRVLEVPDTTCYPRPLRKVPILVGGSGERRTLRLVARSADACNLFGDPDTVRRKVDVLHRHCAEAGRDPLEVSVSQLSTVLIGDDPAHVRALVEQHRPPKVSAERFARDVTAGTVDQHVERVQRFAEVGVDHLIASVVGVEHDGALERWAEVASRCRGLVPVRPVG